MLKFLNFIRWHWRNNRYVPTSSTLANSHFFWKLHTFGRISFLCKCVFLKMSNVKFQHFSHPVIFKFPLTIFEDQSSSNRNYSDGFIFHVMIAFAAWVKLASALAPPLPSVPPLSFPLPFPFHSLPLPFSHLSLFQETRPAVQMLLYNLYCPPAAYQSYLIVFLLLIYLSPFSSAIFYHLIASQVETKGDRKVCGVFVRSSNGHQEKEKGTRQI